MQNDTARKPLSRREYYALRQLFGIVSIFHSCGADLKDRLAGTREGWRDLRMIQSVSDKLTRSLLNTIPAEKLAMLHKELSHTCCEVSVRMPVGIRGDGDPITCVETGPLERMMLRAGSVECFACEKRGKKARACPMRKDVERLLPWGYPEIGKDDACPFADGRIDLEEIMEEANHGNHGKPEDQAPPQTV